MKSHSMGSRFLTSKAGPLSLAAALSFAGAAYATCPSDFPFELGGECYTGLPECSSTQGDPNRICPCPGAPVAKTWNIATQACEAPPPPTMSATTMVVIPMAIAFVTPTTTTKTPATRTPAWSSKVGPQDCLPGEAYMRGMSSASTPQGMCIPRNCLKAESGGSKNLATGQFTCPSMK